MARYQIYAETEKRKFLCWSWEVTKYFIIKYQSIHHVDSLNFSDKKIIRKYIYSHCWETEDFLKFPDFYDTRVEFNSFEKARATIKRLKEIEDNRLLSCCDKKPIFDTKYDFID